MKRFRALMVLASIAVVGSLVIAGWVYAQTAKDRKATVLTPQDYHDITQVYSITYQGNDLGNEAQWLSGFADDAVFKFPNGEETTSKRALAERRAKGFAEKPGDSKRRHWFGTIVVKPNADGTATARAYFVVLDVSGKQAAIVSSGIMDDVFVKTADGWKFKVHVIRTDGTT